MSPDPIIRYPNTQRDINRRFARYLEGKKVAIVGRVNLHKLEQGEFIDSHDVVVRIHSTLPYVPDDVAVRRSVFVPEEWRPFIGSKVNILYHRIHASESDWKETGDVPQEAIQQVDTFYSQGGKFLCHEDPYPFPLRYLIVTQYAEVRFLDLALYAHLGLALKKKTVEPGIVAIADILSHKIDSAYITGFACYFDEISDDPVAGAVTPWRDWKKKRDVNELRFLRDLEKSGRVSFDPIMRELFAKYA